jgi:hypothetical protein
MSWRREEPAYGGALDNPARVHDRYTVHEPGDDAEVVGNPDYGHARSGLEAFHKIQDLLLDGDIEGRGGLVSY